MDRDPSPARPKVVGRVRLVGRRLGSGRDFDALDRVTGAIFHAWPGDWWVRASVTRATSGGFPVGADHDHGWTTVGIRGNICHGGSSFLTLDDGLTLRLAEAEGPSRY